MKYRNIFLYPFSLLYGLITSFRNFLYNAEILRSHKFDIPLICIGNLTAGGTGKTPMTEYLVNLLSPDFNVAVLSRGYKRKTNGFLIVSETSGPEEVGDEPLQISGKFPAITVAVDRERVHGVNALLKQKPDIEVILLDDAFQHRSIKPGFSILLSEYSRLMIHDKMLPYGNLRESITNIERADAIVITKTPESVSPIQRRLIAKDIQKAAYQSLFFSSISYLPPAPVFHNIKAEKNIFRKNNKQDVPGVLLVTGVANPEPLYIYLKEVAGEIITMPFGDHHSFNDKDIRTITEKWESLRTSRRYLITTEKDAVRLREFTNIAEAIRKSSYYIPVDIDFLNDDKEEFDNIILEYVRENKRINRISQGKRI